MDPAGASKSTSLSGALTRVMKIFRRSDPFTAYASAFGFGLLVLLFIVGGAAGLNLNRAPRIEDLPADDSIITFISDFLDPLERGGAIETMPLNAGDVLTSVLPRSYVIKPGDTLSEIADEYNVRIDTLISYNGITDVYLLQVGTQLWIPSMEGVLYRVTGRDTLGGIAKRFGVELNPILDINDLDSEVIKAGDVLFIPNARMDTVNLKRAMGNLFVKPASGIFTSGFGMRKDPFTQTRRMHYGVDWANAAGTPVYAANSGRVSTVGDHRTFGKYVMLEHRGGYQTLYAHLASWNVKKGEWLSQGSVLGRMGNTGRSTGTHLHFAIYLGQKPVDPLDYIH